MVGSMKVKDLLYGLLFLSFSAHGIEDPTRPQAAHTSITKQSLSHPELSSILYADDRKWAIINGEVLSEGELINGFELSIIEKYSVVLVGNNKNLQLSLDKERVDGTDI